MLNGAIYLQGMLVGASLIIPIGAQNAFVLERGSDAIMPCWWPGYVFSVI